jgi:hypothetical protein
MMQRRPNVPPSSLHSRGVKGMHQQSTSTPNNNTNEKASRSSTNKLSWALKLRAFWNFILPTGLSIAIGRSVPSDKLKLSIFLTLVLALAATMGVNDWLSSSQPAMNNIDVFKYTLARPPTIQVPSDLYHSHIIHSVLTRFMVGQPQSDHTGKGKAGAV